MYLFCISCSSTLVCFVSRGSISPCEYFITWVFHGEVGKPEGKWPLGGPRRRWEDNIKMDLQEVGGGYGDWMELFQDRDRWWALVSKVMNFRVPKMRGISWLAAESVSFSRRTLLHGVSRWIYIFRIHLILVLLSLDVLEFNATEIKP